MKRNFYTIYLSLFFVIIGSLPTQAQEENFYEMEVIQELKIEFAEENWRQALDSLRFNGDELLNAQLTINGTTFSDVGVRIKKDRVFMPDQKKNSLFIRLDHKIEGQNYLGNRAVMLSMALRDPSMLREVLAYNIAGKYMAAPKANFAKVQVNDEYYGFFINIEPIDDVFLENNFAYTKGHLFYSNPSGKVKMNDYCLDAAYGNLLSEPAAECYDRNIDLVRGQNFDPFVDLVKALNSDNKQLRANVLDIDQTLWMLAFNNVVANLSSYLGKEAPNYFLYQGEDNRFVPIIWNTNFAFGSSKNIGKGSDLSVVAMEKLDPFLHEKETRKPLVSQLLKDEMNRKVYLSHMRTILYDEFLSGAFEKKAMELQELIKVPLTNDRNRYYNTADFDRSLVATIGKITKIPGLVTFMNNRSRYLKKNKDFLFIPAEIGAPKYKQRKRYSRDQIENFQIQIPVSAFATEVKIRYRFKGETQFQEMLMKDDGKNYDLQAGDNIYGAIITPKPGADELEYYVRAENAKTVSYAPTRYMYELNKVKLSDLNK